MDGYKRYRGCEIELVNCDAGIWFSVLICNIVIIYAVTSGLINQAISEYMRYQGMFQEHFFL
jgi:hypothetical protein